MRGAWGDYTEGRPFSKASPSTRGRAGRARSPLGASAGVAPLLLVGRDLVGARRLLVLVDGHLALVDVDDLRVELDVILEDVGHGRVLEDGLPRALRLARTAVDALFRVDVELVGELVRVARSE